MAEQRKPAAKTTNARTTGNRTGTRRASTKPAAKSTPAADKPADESTNKPVDKPTGTTADTAAESAADTTSGKHAEAKAEAPAEQPAAKPAEAKADAKADAPAGKSTAKTAAAKADRPTDSADTEADRPAGTAAKPKADQSAEKPAAAAADKPADTPAEVAAEKPADPAADDTAAAAKTVDSGAATVAEVATGYGATEAHTVRVLDSAPSLGSLYPKAAISGLTKSGKHLPDKEFRREAVRIDTGELAAYNRVCGFALRDTLPATYPHILAFPMQALLMTDPAFPFAMPGLVHIANRITQHHPIHVGEELELRVRAVDLRDHEKGRQFDMISEALVAGTPVWTDVSTYLRPGGGSGGKSGGKEKRQRPPQATATWRLPGDLGRRYAAVSGDINPIHMHALSARLFGFPKAIAHGMWSKAHCLAAFDGRLPDVYTVDVQFKLPILLPGKVDFAAHRVDDGWDFTVHGSKSGKPHVAGTIRG